MKLNPFYYESCGSESKSNSQARKINILNRGMRLVCAKYAIHFHEEEGNGFCVLVSGLTSYEIFHSFIPNQFIKLPFGNSLSWSGPILL
jgi:hypothetical protein